MKTASATTLVLALFIASVMLTSVSLLGNLDQANSDIRIDELVTGRLGSLFTGPSLWSRYPSFPRPMAAFDLFSMLLVGAVVTTTFYVLRTKLKKPLATVSIAVLILSAVPYALGLLVLQSNTIDVRQCGSWVAVMILGVLYSSLAAAVLAIMELTDWHKKASGWLRRLHRVTPSGLSSSAA